MRVHLPSVREQIAASATLWRRSLALVFAAAPRTALAVGALMAVQAVLPLGTLWASRGVVDAAAQAFAGTGGAPGDGWPLAAWIGLAVALIVAQQVAAPLFQAAQEETSDRLVAHVHGALIAAANRWRGLARFEDPAFADDLDLVRRRAANGPADLLSYGGRFVQSLFTIAAIGVVLWRLHPLAPFLLMLGHGRVVEQGTHAELVAKGGRYAALYEMRAGRYR
jgi:ATP-binding cassette subfamily B protein